jgi:hypothetical protein
MNLEIKVIRGEECLETLLFTIYYDTNETSMFITCPSTLVCSSIRLFVDVPLPVIP